MLHFDIKYLIYKQGENLSISFLVFFIKDTVKSPQTNYKTKEVPIGHLGDY